MYVLCCYGYKDSNNLGIIVHLRREILQKRGENANNYSVNHIKECPIGQKSCKSIQICQIFMTIAY